MLKKVALILNQFVEVELDSIIPNHNLTDDLGLNSLDVINVAIMFEEEFGIEIPDRHIMKFVTVGDVVSYLQEHIN